MILQITPHVLWNQGYTMRKKSHDIFNYTMHTEMSMLEEWRQTKVRIITLTTSTFPILETLNPFYFYAIDYLDSCFDHFITLFSNLNWLTMGAKVHFATYSIFFQNCK
jgi:hypothetical protein